MAKAPVTRASLLERLRDLRNEADWTQFTQLYAPLVYGYLRKKGLQDADAADLTQDSLCSAAQALPKFNYSVKRGSFRGWLFTIVRNKLCRFHTRRQLRGTGDTQTQRWLEAQPDDADDARQWALDYRRRLFAWAAEQVKPQISANNWQAFWRMCAEGQPAPDTAKALGMSLAAVYTAKSRVLARIKQVLDQVSENESAGT